MQIQRLPIPRALIDARRIAAQPDAYPNRPSLHRLADLALRSAQGEAPRQRHRPANSPTRAGIA